jgi:hypothetical protein
MPETGRHGLRKLPRRRPRWQHALRYAGSVAWQGALLVAGVLTAAAISSGTTGTWRLLLAVGSVFAIVAGGQIVLPAIGQAMVRTASDLRRRWNRG